MDDEVWIRGKDISLVRQVQIGLGALKSSMPVSVPVGKRVAREATHSAMAGVLIRPNSTPMALFTSSLTCRNCDSFTACRMCSSALQRSFNLLYSGLRSLLLSCKVDDKCLKKKALPASG